jgi:hypothetical protein
MALITCSECDKSYSDKADACPSCGCPTSLQNKNRGEVPTPKKTQAGSERPQNITVIGLCISGFGLLIALSSFLIVGSQRETVRSGRGGWFRQTTISRTSGEEIAANGMLALGSLTAVGGLAFLLKGNVKPASATTPGRLGSSELDTNGEIVLAASESKREIYYSLVKVLYSKDPDIKYSDNRPWFDKSSLNGDNLIIRSRSEETLFQFSRKTDTPHEGLDTWFLSESAGKES